MTQPLRIAVADDEPLMRRWFESTLTKLGHQVVGSASNGEEVVQQSRREDVPIPIILVSDHHDAKFVDRALQSYVLAYLVKPIKQPDLETAITLVMRRFHQLRVLEQQAGSLTKTLEDRKPIERAKDILMQRVGLDEPSAFKRLQKISQDKNQKLVAAALAHAWWTLYWSKRSWGMAKLKHGGIDNTEGSCRTLCLRELCVSALKKDRAGSFLFLIADVLVVCLVAFGERGV